MRALAPLILRPKYYDRIRAEIDRIFLELIFQPLANALAMDVHELENAKDDALISALKSGSVWYDDGKFRGAFNSKISRRLKEIGAFYSPKSKAWIFNGILPAEISMANAQARVRYELLQSTVLNAIDGIRTDMVTRISTTPAEYSEAIGQMNFDFMKTIKSLAVPPKLTDEMRRRIAGEWGRNLDLYIKAWADENILALRQKIQQNTFEGYRSASMVAEIQRLYGVSRTKAKFLARQETSLLMSKFRETRYGDLGITRYRWSGSMDQRERPDHKALEGKIFDFRDPPIVDKATGRRANPGEDFGCRCLAVALVE